ncbi:universal stress protein [Streptococcus phocae subsp. phocae]|uniref:Universal stress protein n=1 Tax=Streptococcus phocae TaxID=119224 RepID=A0A0P6SQJ0_9STRE|nr:universal stress protein [Streptococcus phocae]KPJ21932.1 universal stress protein UspA [Streptococcus phocae]
MPQQYKRIIAAVDGSYESELAVEKAINVALRNDAELLLTHVIDAHAYSGEAVFSDYVFDRQEQETKEVLAYYEKMAQDRGLTKIKKIIDIGNPKVLLAKDIPDREQADLIMVGATGLNTFERLLIGSSSEYVLRHAKIDLLVVRDSHKTF